MFEVPAGAKGWLVIFHPRSKWWVEAICPGRWKHVSAIGFVPEAEAWSALSWELGRLRAAVVPDGDFEKWLIGHCGQEKVGILRVAAPDFDRGPWRPRLGLFCVSMVSHLLGVRGALLPRDLWRILLANGAEVVTDGRPICPENDSTPTDREREGGGRRR